MISVRYYSSYFHSRVQIRLDLICTKMKLKKCVYFFWWYMKKQSWFLFTHKCTLHFTQYACVLETHDSNLHRRRLSECFGRWFRPSYRIWSSVRLSRGLWLIGFKKNVWVCRSGTESNGFKTNLPPCADIVQFSEQNLNVQQKIFAVNTIIVLEPLSHSDEYHFGRYKS